jgi:KRAB domain-containing zinc finger protein
LCQIDGCEKLFKTNFELKIHEKSHSNVKDFVCAYCKLQYKTKSTLSIHVKRKHQNSDKEELYPCEECGSTFRLRVDLKTHISNVHKAKIMPKNTCTLCSKSFSLKAHLQEHILIHTGEKPYKCEHCSAEFRTNSNLKKHLKVHTGVKDNVCTICNTAFRRSDHLKNHVSKHHRNPNELEESNNRSKQSTAVGDNLTMIEIPEDTTYNDNQQSNNTTYVFTF